MRLLLAFLFVFISSFPSSIVLAVEAEQLSYVTEAVIAICRGGTKTGDNKSLEIKAEGEGRTIIIKKLIEGGLSGEVKVSEKEWNGITALVDTQRFYECVQEALPILLSSLDDSIDRNSLTLAEKNYGEGGRFYFKPDFRPEYDNSYFRAYLNGVEFENGKSKLSVEIVTKEKSPIKLHVNLSDETSIIGNRGGACFDKNDKMKVQGIPSGTRGFSRSRSLQLGESISFVISEIPCTSDIVGQKITATIPYYIGYDKVRNANGTYRIREYNTIIFAGIDLK